MTRFAAEHYQQKLVRRTPRRAHSDPLIKSEAQGPSSADPPLRLPVVVMTLTVNEQLADSPPPDQRVSVWDSDEPKGCANKQSIEPKATRKREMGHHGKHFPPAF